MNGRSGMKREREREGEREMNLMKSPVINSSSSAAAGWTDRRSELLCCN